MNENNMVRLDRKYIHLIRAALDKIRKELDRLYWNKYQEEMDNPFDNTGGEYVNSTFQVHAYYWGDDEDLIVRPNFEYKDLWIYWYKHSNRDTRAFYISEDISSDYLANMLDECIKSMRKDFGEEDDVW